MSHEQNTILEENAWEQFIEKYLDDDKFRLEVHEKFTDQELWLYKENCEDEDALERVFDNYYNPLEIT